ncbi:hypothetical protein IW261DRAFT_1341957 [Armillaria novae-zelandiae]|uniref:Uncharacterized protein n=1 Tax=Armillaria novae-zelandiae TaxID=153914 RepID=A0AA39NY51_9AGAR|nr:hypothetical protein IW261DRAFT_1341957 [Armillaria novae-zelandiae]
MEQNYDLNMYLAVTLAPNSSYYKSPEALSAIHPLATLVGQVGALDDVWMLSVSMSGWGQRSEEVLASLKADRGIQRVDVQWPRQRSKRDEL